MFYFQTATTSVILYLPFSTGPPSPVWSTLDSDFSATAGISFSFHPSLWDAYDNVVTDYSVCILSPEPFTSDCTWNMYTPSCIVTAAGTYPSAYTKNYGGIGACPDTEYSIRGEEGS